MKNKIKAVISDLDGTLLNNNGIISRYTVSRINRLIKQGKKFFIASGRSKDEITPILKDELKLEDSFFITLNGARVYDSDWNLIISHDLQRSIVEEILKEPEENFIYFVHLVKNNEDIMYTDEKCFKIMEDLHKKNDKYFRYFFSKEEAFNVNYKVLKSFKEIEHEFDIIPKIIIMGEEEALIKKEAQIIIKHNEVVNTSLSTPRSLEIVSQEVSKGRASREILKKLGISFEQETITFGDGFNDFDMLNESYKGLIMGNAQYRLKEQLPHLEVIGINENDAVAKYIEENLLD